ncbi:MAG: hypothetical protein WCK77_15055 [Verrucomicrobiota bacterium]
MSETEVSVILILLAVCVGLLLVLVGLAVRGGHRLQHIERLLKPRQTAREAARESAVAVAGSAASQGEFETFLAEDPARRQLSKQEQFGAYRRWRQDKGLNWSKS